MASPRQRQCGVSEERGVSWMEVTMISRGVEISMAGVVAETKDGLTTVTFFFF